MRSSLSAPFTFSATFTWPTRNSTFRKSSIVIVLSTAAGTDAGGDGATTAGVAACPGRVPVPAGGSSGLAVVVALLLHLLHPFDGALVSAREYGLDPTEFCPKLQLSPSERTQVELVDFAEAKLAPNARCRIRDDRMHERGHN